MATISIGNVKCPKSEKRFGELSLAEDPVSEVRIPVGVINGSKPGPVVCIIAGTHACEYVGIDTAIRLFHNLSPSKVKGALLILPVINPVAFKTITPYVNPMDGLNMSFMFTGSKDATTTERMCTVILEEAVFQSNYVMDLHGGDLNEIMLPSVMAGITGDKKVDDESMDLARSFRTEYIILHKPEESPSTAAKYSYESTIESQAAKKGIPGVVAEIGANGLSPKEDVDYYFNCVQNSLRYLKVLNGKPKVQRGQKAISGSFRARTTTGGIFTSSRRVGEYLRKGDAVGKVTDLKGDLKEEIKSPSESLLTLLFTKHVVNSGQIVASLTTKIEPLPTWKPKAS